MRSVENVIPNTKTPPASIELPCPNCGKHLSFDAGFAGTIARCDACRAMIRITADQPKNPSAQPTTNSASTTRPFSANDVGAEPVPSTPQSLPASRPVWQPVLAVSLIALASFVFIQWLAPAQDAGNDQLEPAPARPVVGLEQAAEYTYASVFGIPTQENTALVIDLIDLTPSQRDAVHASLQSSLGQSEHNVKTILANTLQERIATPIDFSSSLKVIFHSPAPARDRLQPSLVSEAFQETPSRIIWVASGDWGFEDAMRLSDQLDGHPSIPIDCVWLCTKGASIPTTIEAIFNSDTRRVFRISLP